MQICLFLVFSLLVLSLPQDTTSRPFSDGDSFKIISASNTECLGDKIQFSVEFEDQNLIESSLVFKLNLQSRNNLDNFFANCIFEVPESSDIVSDHVNYEINNEEILNSEKTIFRKNDKLRKSRKLKSRNHAICIYDSIYKQGNYILKTNPENLNVIIENEIEIDLIPCDFKIIRLSFR